MGNDFVVVDAAEVGSGTDWTGAAIRLCARRYGVGADGLLVVSRDATDAAFRMRMFNPDGSEDMCGNGLRCVALWAHRAGWLGGQDTFFVATKDGPHRAQILSADAAAAQVRVDMGVPHFHSHDIPFCCGTEEQVVDFPLRVAGRTFPITAMNTGSTHTVIFVDARDDETFARCSPLIEEHPLFPERTSIMWATPKGTNHFRIRIWERGAGETFGCGTGACAVGVAAHLHGLTDPEQPVRVESRGGTLEITWPGGSAPISMAGPAQIVFDGEFALASLA